MASESVEEKKQNEEAPALEGKEDPKPEEDEVGKDQVTEEEEVKEEVAAEEGEEEGKKGDEEDAKKEEDAKEEVKEDEEEEVEDAEEEVVDEEESKKEKKIPRKRGSKASAEKKEPVTPSSERPTRERKMVERYSVPEPGRSVTKPLSIEKGRGTQLKDIPNVAYKLSKRKPDDNMQMLHTILFGKKAKAHNLKKNISQFSGYVWIENEEKQKSKVREKLDKCVKEKLLDFCDLLNIPINKAIVKKEELTGKILDFLESPHATTDVLLADKEQKGKKRKATPGKTASPGEASVTPAKKRKQTPPRGEKRKHSSKDDEEEDEDKVESPEAKDDPHVDSEDDAGPNEESDQQEDNSEEEEDEPEVPTKKVSSKKVVKQSSGAKSGDKATPGKKGTPAKPVKSPAKSAKKPSGSSKKGAADTDGTSGSVSKLKGSASKKQKVDKEDPKDQNVSSKDKVTNKKQSGNLPSKASAKDQGRVKSGKKAKAEPTRKEMHTVVVDILKEVDFNTATLSDILRQLGTHFGVDLMHRKAEVKDIITDVINSMSDEEEDEEADDAEAGGDADKDGDDEDEDEDDDA